MICGRRFKRGVERGDTAEGFAPEPHPRIKSPAAAKGIAMGGLPEGKAAISFALGRGEGPIDAVKAATFDRQGFDHRDGPSPDGHGPESARRRRIVLPPIPDGRALATRDHQRGQPLFDGCA